ncbi:MAG TPA: glycosyltransferase family 2 protein [Nocardioidaceae bacterium]|nr:glycosyltransferase family 2 protein [Nocardioidaceae bacterium]
MTTARVTALLVSHDGARWLPAVLDGVTSQTRPVDAFLAVDTASSDGSADILRERLGHESVLAGRERWPFATAVRHALSVLPPAVEDEWVWILHDDSNPAPGALEQLLDAATPEIAVLGPKLREWPSLRRLLELGVTISGTGRRETGLERGEYDQGQHDRKRDVLAVNTAGMLVRREVLETIGFDTALPVYGNDIDFGWRAARAGHRTVVVPDAVVFHAEAAHRGVRRTPLTGSRFHRAERQAALYTLLVNGSTAGLPWRLVRLLLGSLVRMLGFLLVRAPGEAYDELAAVVRTYARFDRLIAGRRVRRRTATVRHKDVKHLLAPTWLPYRHGLDFVSDVAAAVVNQAADLAAARRTRALAETGPVDEEAQSLDADSGLVARLVASPIAWVFAALLLLAALAVRGHLGGGSLSGGALLPPPDSAGYWWSRAFEGWHDLGVGSTAPAPPYLLPLAAAGTLLLGKAWLVIDLLLFLAVPAAAFGAFRFLRRLTDSWTAALWGGVAYGLLPVVSGAVQQGRLGTVVTALVLPWFAHAALHLFIAETEDRRSRAVFRAALWLALASAFAPLVLMLAVAGVVLFLLLTARVRPDLAAGLARSLLGTVAVAAALLLPWLLLLWGHDGVSSLLLEAGRPASELIGSLTATDIVLGRPGDVGGAPAWLSVGIAVAAVVALLRSDTRRRVLVAWSFVLLGLAATALLSGVRVEVDATGTEERIWLGVPLLLVQAAAITAVAVAGTGIREQLSTHAFGWRQPVGAAVVVVALVTPLVGLVWWAVAGTDGPIDRGSVTAVPEYMTDAAERDSDQGILVVRGSQRDGFRYVLLRDRGLRVGDEAMLPTAEEQEPLTALVGELASVPGPDALSAMIQRGVQFVYAPAPVDQQLAGNLDSLSGLAPASSLARESRAWRLDGAVTTDTGHRGDALRPWLVGLECLGIVVAAVFAAPTRRRQER